MNEPLEPPVLAPAPSARRRVVMAMKVLGFIAVVLFALRRPDLIRAVFDALAAADPRWWLAGVVALFGTLAFNAVRTELLVRASGFRIPLLSLYGDVVQAVALNAVLLIGVDVLYRGRRMAPVVGSFERGVAIAVLDRFFGFLAMFVAGCVGFAVLGARLSLSLDPVRLAALLGVGVVGSIVALVVLPARLRALWERISPVVAPLFADPPRLAGVLVCSAGTYAGAVVSVFCLSRGLGQPAPFTVYLAVVPIVSIATVLPVSIGGIGIREAGYATLLGAYGVSGASAVALGLSQYGTFLVTAAVGGAIALARAAATRRSG